MKKTILASVVAVALVLVSGCMIGTHKSVTTSVPTTLPDLNTNGITPGEQTVATNMNTTTVEDVKAPN